MIEDALLRELDEMAEDPDIDGGRMFDVVIAVGSDQTGLRELVDCYGRSDHPLLPGYVAMALSRAAWNWEPPDPELCDVVLDFVEAVGNATHPGLLSTTCNALKGLDASRILQLNDVDRQARLGEFLLHCLDQHRFTAPSACIEFLSDLWSEGVLEQILPPSTIAALKERLARLASENREEFSDELASFRAFWEAR